ncbi:1-aminocyclopropane-1-carboxylate deaminase/D-cysteine desulfhydrase [Thalassotalea maritima]|uniref:1-aminocyclopropane-1-carboxylate deaminase/D-cysteine desulfhydrase n=1 Tax=Thalassotalea maritima TaxID=3242416 RepID=UPI0035277583
MSSHIQSASSPLQPINLPEFSRHQLNVYIKRDDLIHPIISGNKWRKLKYNILAAKQQGASSIISFGGAYSNHIHVLAYACNQQKIGCIGVIRGEPHYANNFTLQWAQHWGMKLHFVDRQTYRLRQEKDFQQQLLQQYPSAFLVPEGGSNQQALIGVGEVIAEIDNTIKSDYLLTPVGSGGTIAGLIKADNNRKKIIGVSVLKQDGYLEQEINQLLDADEQTPSAKFNNWHLVNDQHLGGYGKFSQADAIAISELSKRLTVPLEPIYSGKMMLAFMNLVKQGYFPAGATIVLLHTGGIQGLGGLHERGLIDPSLFLKPLGHQL